MNAIPRSSFNKSVAVLLVAMPVLLGLNIILVSGSDTRAFLSNLFQVVAALVATWVTILAVRKLRREASDSAAGWLVIAVAQGLFATGTIAYMFVEIGLKLPPYPGVPDAFFLLFYPAMILGLWRLPREPITRREMWDNILDVAAVAVVTVLVTWELNLRIFCHSLATGPNLIIWVSFGYTLMDWLLLLMIFSRLARKLGQGRQFLPMLLLVIGCLFLSAADLLQGYVATYTNFTSGSIIDLGWVVFSSLSGLAALDLLHRGDDAGDGGPSGSRLDLSRTFWMLAITYAWIVLALVLLAWAMLRCRTEDIHPLVLVTGVVMACFLGVTRQIRFMCENARLYQELQGLAVQLETKVMERTSELNQQTERLRESEAFRKRVFDASPVAIGVMDPVAFKLVDCNPAAVQIFGFSSREETLSTTPLDVAAPVQDDGTPSMDKARHYVERVLAEGTIIFEWRHQRSNGEIWDAEVHLMSFQSGTRQLLQFTLQDITERKRADAALHLALEEKTSLVKEIHHRVKNNLAIMVSLINMQARQIKHPEAVVALADTKARLFSMSLLHEMLYRSGRMDRVEIKGYLEHLCRHLAHTLGMTAQRIQIQCRSSSMLTLEINQAVPCGLIVSELVSNALKHAFPDAQKGEVMIDLEVGPAENVVLRVTDNGIGLPDGLKIDQLASVGLTLVDTLTRQLGGTLDVRRENGTLFEIRFPLRLTPHP
jgi:PAS domain S-box-containing protein